MAYGVWCIVYGTYSAWCMVHSGCTYGLPNPPPRHHHHHHHPPPPPPPPPAPPPPPLPCTPRVRFIQRQCIPPCIPTPLLLLLLLRIFLYQLQHACRSCRCLQASGLFDSGVVRRLRCVKWCVYIWLYRPTCTSTTAARLIWSY
jgi:hypothetical protein